MADELDNLRKRVEELMQQNEELEEMVVEKDNTIKELASAQGKIVEDMELKIKELKDIISEKEVLIEQLGGGEEQGEGVEDEATRDPAPDVAKQLTNKNSLIESLRETIKHLESTNNSLRRREDEFKTMEQKMVGLKHQRNLMNISLGLVHMDVEEIRLKVHQDLIAIKEAKETIDMKNNRYAKLAEEYEKLCREKKAPKKIETKIVDEDRTYAALLNVLEEHMEKASGVVVTEDEEVSVNKVKTIHKTLETTLMNLEADKAVRSTNFGVGEEVLGVNLRIKRTENGYRVLDVELGEGKEEELVEEQPKRKAAKKHTNVFSDSD